MFKNIHSFSLISKLLGFERASGSEVDFHKKAHKLLPEIGSVNFISKIFEQNLKDSNFLKKEWNSCEIPQLTIYDDEQITLRYHFFLPVKTLNKHNAAYLIHHHGDNILSSYIFYGPGYQTIEFQKEISMFSNNSYKLKISKDFFHSNGATNLLKDWIPHLIFNVSKPTASVALWSNSKPNLDEHVRLNYTLEKGKFYGFSDEGFFSEASKDSRFEHNSERHIQAICYFMQQVGYNNKPFISKIVSEVQSENFWSKWLTKLKNNEQIKLPYFDDRINTLGREIGIEEVRKFCRISVKA